MLVIMVLTAPLKRIQPAVVDSSCRIYLYRLVFFMSSLILPIFWLLIWFDLLSYTESEVSPSTGPSLQVLTHF